MNHSTNNSLLEVRNLSKDFPVGQGFFGGSNLFVRAVDNVSLTLAKGETLGLVGESGCGKSTLARCILRLIEPDQGEIIFSGEDLRKFSQNELRVKRKNFHFMFICLKS